MGLIDAILRPAEPAPGAGAPPAGKPDPAPAGPSPSVELRRQRDDIASGAVPRGRGRPIGSKTKAKAEPPPPVDPASVHKKFALVHRGIGYSLAHASNCTAFLLDAEQEAMLGEAWGDIAIELGFSDSLALKVAFLAGVTGSIYGGNFLRYRAYAAEQRALKARAEKRPEAAQPAQPETPRPPDEGRLPPEFSTPKGAL